MYQLVKKSNPLLKFIGFLFVISITAELLKVIFQPPSIDEQLINTVKEINKHCPMMVDSITRLDNSTVLPNNDLHFNYTYIKNNKNDIDTSVLKNSMLTSFINKLMTDPKFKDFKLNNVSISATFYDSAGNYVCNIFVDPKQILK